MSGLYVPTVLVLILQLGSPNFREREAAHARLAGDFRDAAPLVALFNSHPDAEIAARCRRLTAKQLRICPPLPDGLYPYIDELPFDGMPCDRNETIAAYSGWGRELVPLDRQGEIGGWHDYRKATELYFWELASQGWTAGRLQTLMMQMDASERVKYGGRYEALRRLPEKVVPELIGAPRVEQEP